MSQGPTNAIVSGRPSRVKNQASLDLTLVNPDGTAYSAAGELKKKTAIVALTKISATAVPNAAAAPTQAEFNALVASHNSLKTLVNQIIDSLKN